MGIFSFKNTYFYIYLTPKKETSSLKSLSAIRMTLEPWAVCFGFSFSLNSSITWFHCDWPLLSFCTNCVPIQVRLLQEVLARPYTEQPRAEERAYASPPPHWARGLKVSCSSWRRSQGQRLKRRTSSQDALLLLSQGYHSVLLTRQKCWERKSNGQMQIFWEDIFCDIGGEQCFDMTMSAVTWPIVFGRHIM